MPWRRGVGQGMGWGCARAGQPGEVDKVDTTSPLTSPLPVVIAGFGERGEVAQGVGHGGEYGSGGGCRTGAGGKTTPFSR
jgi:hypothetical protein